MDHAGAVVGPLIGYFVLAYVAENPNAPTASDYRQVFLFASVPALCAVLAAAFLIREKKPTSNTIDATLEDAAPPPRLHLTLRGFDANFKRFLFIIALFTLSNSADSFLLLRAKEVGIASTTLLLMWAALHVSKVVSSLIGGDLSDRFGRKRLIAAGWLVYAFVYVGFAYADSSREVWLLFLIYGAYFGLVEGAEKALVADLVPESKRGTAYGLYNLAFGITVLPASYLFGEVWKLYGSRTAFLASACVSLLAILLLTSLVKIGVADREQTAPRIA